MDPESIVTDSTKKKKKQYIIRRPRSCVDEDRMSENDDIDHYKNELEKEKQHSQKLLQTISSLENKIEKLIDQIEILNKSVIKMQNEKDILFERLNQDKASKKSEKKSKSKSHKNAQTKNSNNKHANKTANSSQVNSHDVSEHTSDNGINTSISANTESNTSMYSDAQMNNEDSEEDKNTDIHNSTADSEILSVKSEETTSQQMNIKRSNKIPPIDIWTDNRAEIQRIIQNKLPLNSCVFGRINNGKFRIFPNSAEIREKVISFAKERGYAFNTYTPTDCKMINIIIKGLDHVDDPAIIENELESNGIVPYKIEKFTTGYMRKNKVKSNLWHLILQPNTDTKTLFAIRIIDQAIVKFEFLRKPMIIQCKRCQRFNHSASNCNLPYRCVKCTNQHEPGQCRYGNETNKVKPKCVNCQGNHTANDGKNCPIFQKVIANKSKKKNNTKVTKESNKSYAELLKTKPNNADNIFKTSVSKSRPNVEKFIQQQSNMLTGFIKEIMRMQNCFLESLNANRNG